MVRDEVGALDHEDAHLPDLELDPRQVQLRQRPGSSPAPVSAPLGGLRDQLFGPVMYLPR